MKNYALIFAGGSGTRMHSRSVPKQFLKLYGKEIIVYTLENFQKHKMIDGIVVACKKDRISFLKQLVQDYGLTKVRAIVNGGKTSGESIFNALSELKKTEQEPSVVLINDGVRPLISQELITECIKCTVKNGNAIACSPATETIIREEKNRVTEILDRSLCTFAKAPQCFFLDDIYNAHLKIKNAQDFIDSATLMKAAGARLFTVESSPENIKITTPSDFYIFKALYDAKENMDVFGL